MNEKPKNGTAVVSPLSLSPGAITYIPSDVYATHEGRLYRMWQGVQAGQLREIREWRPVPQLRDIDPEGRIINE